MRGIIKMATMNTNGQKSNTMERTICITKKRGKNMKQETPNTLKGELKYSFSDIVCLLNLRDLDGYPCIGESYHKYDPVTLESYCKLAARVFRLQIKVAELEAKLAPKQKRKYTRHTKKGKK